MPAGWRVLVASVTRFRLSNTQQLIPGSEVGMLVGGLGDDVHVVEPRRLVLVSELQLDLGCDRPMPDEEVRYKCLCTAQLHQGL